MAEDECMGGYPYVKRQEYQSHRFDIGISTSLGQPRDVREKGPIAYGWIGRQP